MISNDHTGSRYIFVRFLTAGTVILASRNYYSNNFNGSRTTNARFLTREPEFGEIVTIALMISGRFPVPKVPWNWFPVPIPLGWEPGEPKTSGNQIWSDQIGRFDSRDQIGAT